MNCPKHVEFYSKNKFEKLVQLVCFITRVFMVENFPLRCHTVSTYASYLHTHEPTESPIHRYTKAHDLTSLKKLKPTLFILPISSHSQLLLSPAEHTLEIAEELETNLMSLVIFITLNICSTCFEH